MECEDHRQQLFRRGAPRIYLAAACPRARATLLKLNGPADHPASLKKTLDRLTRRQKAGVLWANCRDGRRQSTHAGPALAVDRRAVPSRAPHALVARTATISVKETGLNSPGRPRQSVPRGCADGSRRAARRAGSRARRVVHISRSVTRLVGRMPSGVPNWFPMAMTLIPRPDRKHALERSLRPLAKKRRGGTPSFANLRGASNAKTGRHPEYDRAGWSRG